MQANRKKVVVGVGEVLWDILPGGKQLGGASANFAYHAQMLGAEAWLISCVGSDPLGREILERLQEMQLLSEGVTVDSSAPTGTVSIELAHDGQPKFAIRENVAWDHIRASEFARATVARADAICFGSLAQRNETSRNEIRALVASTRASALRIFDVNLRQRFYTLEVIRTSLEMANVLKINDEELPVLAKLFGLTGGMEEQIATLAHEFNLKLVALTRGARGSVIYAQGNYSRLEGLPARVVDTIGAGDAFTATLAMGILAGWELEQINRCANEVAAFVVSQPGAMPRLPEHLCSSAAFRELNPATMG